MGFGVKEGHLAPSSCPCVLFHRAEWPLCIWGRGWPHGKGPRLGASDPGPRQVNHACLEVGWGVGFGVLLHQGFGTGAR